MQTAPTLQLPAGADVPDCVANAWLTNARKARAISQPTFPIRVSVADLDQIQSALLSRAAELHAHGAVAECAALYTLHDTLDAQAARVAA